MSTTIFKLITGLLLPLAATADQTPNFEAAARSANKDIKDFATFDLGDTNVRMKVRGRKVQVLWEPLKEKEKSLPTSRPDGDQLNYRPPGDPRNEVIVDPKVLQMLVPPSVRKSENIFSVDTSRLAPFKAAPIPLDSSSASPAITDKDAVVSPAE